MFEWAFALFINMNALVKHLVKTFTKKFSFVLEPIFKKLTNILLFQFAFYFFPLNFCTTFFDENKVWLVITLCCNGGLAGDCTLL